MVAGLEATDETLEDVPGSDRGRVRSEAFCQPRAPALLRVGGGRRGSRRAWKNVLELTEREIRGDAL